MSLLPSVGRQPGVPSPYLQPQPNPINDPDQIAIVSYLDPISRQQLNLPPVGSDSLLKLNPFQKLKLDIKNTFVTLPKSIYHGLRGDESFSFTNFLQVSSIPYYMGGAFLAGSFAAGGDRVNTVRQGLGVGLYYLGVVAATKLVHAFYKATTGVDLDLRYRKSDNGSVEKVFASTTFPRVDLLDDAAYQKIAQKLNIPPDVADQKQAVNNQVLQIISAAQVDTLVVGNVMAAVGAGYMARSDGWARLLGAPAVFKTIWNKQDNEAGSSLDRMQRSVQALQGLVKPAIKEKLFGFAGESNPWVRRGILGGIAALIIAVPIHGFKLVNTARQEEYQPPFPSSSDEPADLPDSNEEPL